MKRILHNDWEFLFASAVTRGKWMMDPLSVLGMAPQLAKLITSDGSFNRDWKGMQTLDLDKMGSRSDLPTLAIAATHGDKYQDYNEAPKGSIAIIPLKGMMMKYGTWWAYGTEEIAAMIIEAAGHPNIGGVVIEGDSGGGYVDSIAPLLYARKFVRDQGKVFGASVDLCASACLYALIDADFIVADNQVSSQSGSIGVMLSFWDIIPYFEELGLKFHYIKSNHSEDKNLSWEKALKGEYDKIKEEELDPLAIEFQNHVKSSRGEKLNIKAPGILTGAMFYAQEALENGLIDKIGDKSTAIQMAHILIESKNFL